jgi:flavin-dependent dehydrogenase
MIKIAVIGLGPGGSSCVLALNEALFDIHVFDKKQFPRNKVCGDAISPEVFNTLKELDEDFSYELLSHEATNPIDSIEIFDSKSSVISLNTSDILPQNNSVKPHIATRYSFDYLLYKKVCSKKNVTLHQKSIAAINKQNDLVCLETDDEEKLFFNIVVFANGYNKITAENIFKKPSVVKYIGIRKYIQSDMLNKNSMYFFFIENKLPVYFWAFHVNENIFNVGLYFLKSNSSEVTTAYVNYLKHHQIDKKHIANILFDSIEYSKYETSAIPYTSSIDNIVGINFISIGASAGFSDPLTGEGISHAVKSGVVAAKTLNKLKSGKLSEDIQAYYKSEIESAFMKKSRQSYFLQQKLSSTFVFSIIIFLIRRFRVFKKVFSKTYIIRTHLLKK